MKRDIYELLAAANEPPAATASRSLLREDVYARIRNWIVEGLVPPGTRLRDNDIAEALQVSRTPVREAIRRLQDEGLVVAEASRWTKVAPVDIGAADRIYPMIWTLEHLAMDTGGRWTSDRLATLRGANERLAAALVDSDPLAASAADAAFHRIIIDGAANDELATVLEQLKVRLRRIEINYFEGSHAGEPSVQEHERVILALEAGDLPAAGAALETNWRASLERLHRRWASREPVRRRPGTRSKPTALVATE